MTKQNRQTTPRSDGAKSGVKSDDATRRDHPGRARAPGEANPLSEKEGRLYDRREREP